MRLASDDDRDAAVAKAAQRGEPSCELALAAVDHDHVRQRGEAASYAGSCGEMSAWRSHCAKRRPRTSAIAA